MARQGVGDDDIHAAGVAPSGRPEVRMYYKRRLGALASDKAAGRTRHLKNKLRAAMNSNTPFHVVLDIDGTTPPITVVSGSDTQYIEAASRRIKRTADFRKDYRKDDGPPLTVRESIAKNVRSCFKCDDEHRRKCIQKRFPVYRTIRKYDWRSDLPNDLVAGLTVGIMQIPQGMAYALLAEMPPVTGLYMAFFPVLIYFLLGTSRHISMGTIAVCSLLTGSVIARFYEPSLAALVMGDRGSDPVYDMTGNDTLPSPDEQQVDLPDHVKYKIATSICLLVGLVQVFMGFFKLGFVTTYMSDPMIGGFTTGAAVHVGTSQVKYLFGLKIARSDGVFQIIKTYMFIFKHIAETNVPTLIMSIICIIILYLVKVQINMRFKSRMKVPVPIELLVVVAGTLLSYFFTFSETYKIRIVGEIPAGLPLPEVPSFQGLSVYSTDIFIIAVVSFSQSVSLAALMAKKHCYSYDANQELIAHGAGNIFGSFFSCYPYAASVSRSSVQESAGGRTQVASVVSAGLVLIIIVSIGPLFKTLPNCVLAAIIVVALRSLFLQFKELPKILRTSVYDFLIWLVTFLCTVVLHVDYGILLGILFSFFTVVVRTQRTKAEPLQKIPEVHLYENSTAYSRTESCSGIKVVGFQAPLYYANGDLFVKQVQRLSGVVPEKRRKWMKKMTYEKHVELNKRLSALPLVTESDELGSVPNLTVFSDLNKPKKEEDETSAPKATVFVTPKDSSIVHHIIIDCSGITFIDTVGSKILKQIAEDYDSVHVRVLLACVKDSVWHVLKTTNFLASHEDRLFLTVDDAVNSAMLQSNNEQASKPKYPQRLMYRENNNPDAQEGDTLLTSSAEL